MELDQALDFVGGRIQGALMTLRRDGRPAISNIVYKLGDDGVIRISTSGTRAKAKNLGRDPRASLYVAGDNFWQYVVIDGEAELTPVAAAPDDPTVEELVVLYHAIQGEHPDWDEYRAAMVSEQRVVVRLRPTRAYGQLGG